MKINIIKDKFLKDILFNKIYLALSVFPFLFGFICYFIEQNRYSVCPLINLTHIPCPLCGITRSFSNLVHLKFINAIKYNPLAVVFSFIFFFIIVVHIIPQNLKKRLYFFMKKNILLVNVLFYFLIILILTFGIIRIFDIKFNIIGFNDVVPERTILKSFQLQNY